MLINETTGENMKMKSTGSADVDVGVGWLDV